MHTYTDIKTSPTSRLPYSDHNSVQGEKEIFHLILNDQLASFPFQSIPRLPLIVQLLPCRLVAWSQPITLFAAEDKVGPSLLLYPAQSAKGVLRHYYPAPFPHIPLTHTQLRVFFFFFFYSLLTLHLPTCMAGGPVHTPTQGANYIRTSKMENRKRRQTNDTTPLLPLTPHPHVTEVPHPYQNLIEVPEEILHSIPDNDLASVPLHRVPLSPLII